MNTAIDNAVDVRAGNYVEREVYFCDSWLVDDLLRRGDVDGFQIDNIEGLYPDPFEWSLAECHEWLEDIGIDCPDDNPWAMDLAQLREWNTGAVLIDEPEAEQMTEDDLRKAIIDAIDEGGYADNVAEWRDAISDNAEMQEVLEWWRVSSWMYEQLREIGEPGINNGYGHWWGRTCTGQKMIMDGTFQQIARKFT